MAENSKHSDRKRKLDDSECGPNKRMALLERSKEANVSCPSRVPVAVSCSAVASSSKSAQVLQKDEITLKNEYARELFFKHTNIREVVEKHNSESSSTKKEMLAERYYSIYVLKPKYRIRAVLEEIRFDTRHSEGLFRMALTIPLTSAQEHETYKQNLAKRGIKKMLFVDMTKQNRLLEYQGQLISCLKDRFTNWSNKLNKTSKYLAAFQKQREIIDRRFLHLLKHKSSIADSKMLLQPNVVQHLLLEVHLPREKRQHPLWAQLRFEDDMDGFNRKYGLEVYSKSQINVEIENIIHHSPVPRSVDDPSLLPSGSAERTAHMQIVPHQNVVHQSKPQKQQKYSVMQAAIQTQTECVLKIEATSQTDPVPMGPPTESSPLVIIDVQSPAEEARNGIAQGNEDDIELVNFSSANSLESRINYVTKAEPSSTSLPRIGLYIKNETTRNRNRQILFATTIPRIGPTNLYMVYLNYIDIQSIRYTKIPTIWPQCNVFQQNELTVNLNPEGCPGLFSVPLRDNQACEMLGLPVGGKGREAFLAVLRHVGKVRYGSKEPAKQYYIMSVTEKVLHLLFATVPPCPRNGGLVLFPKIKSCLPADGDDGYLERFNYYVHTKRAAEETANKGESLVCLLQLGIAGQMRRWRQKLMQANRSNV